MKRLERGISGNGSLPIDVAIVGCGYSGVELAATISERLQSNGKVQAINVQMTICPSAPPGNREAALKVRINMSLWDGLFYLGIKASVLIHAHILWF